MWCCHVYFCSAKYSTDKLSTIDSGRVNVKKVLDSVVAVDFQITFRVEMHANDFFYFLKIIFDISTLKRSKTYKPY